MQTSQNPRHTAFLAALASVRQEEYAEVTLKRWREATAPADRDWRLAQQIAYGTVRMARALDHLAKQLAAPQTLRLKRRERVLLRTALFQLHYLSKLPAHAVVSETVQIAKALCHQTTANYLNQLLRKYAQIQPVLPDGNDPDSLAIRLSYPTEYVRQLIEQLGQACAVEVLEAGNLSPKTMGRVRKDVDEPLPTGLERDGDNPSLFTVVDGSVIKELVNSPRYYLQNGTPIKLTKTLATKTPAPTTLLDLCAAPGGKLLLAHDLWPKAQLHANDVSEEKLALIQDNLTKYGIEADLRAGSGIDYPVDRQFNLVIVDAPCSNTGVLSRRPEARWRLETDGARELEHLQQKLLAHAAQLVAPGGMLWYMTCSILEQENQEAVTLLIQDGWEVCCEQLHLPEDRGLDGGYGIALRRK